MCPGRKLLCLLALWPLIFAYHSFAGGSGLNTIVVVNQSSSNSVEVGNYYCERRQVPPENLLRINWAGGNVSWTNSDYQAVLLQPLLDLIAARQLSGQIDYVVLSMDIPFQTIYDGVVNGTTSALYYGPKTETGPDWVNVTNSYSGSEQPFSFAKPASSRGYSFLAAMITAATPQQAKRLIDQGVASDGACPWQPVFLEKTSDPLRNFRYWHFDNTIFNSQLCQGYSITRTNCDSPWGQTNLLGIQTGLYQFALSPNTFVPGAMADSLTSYGGVIFGPNDHTTLLSFINAGACGSYGTVVEPTPVPEKFPDPRAYFYQARGFTIAECYYQSLDSPYEGLIVAEPLAAPFRRSAHGRWSGISSNVVLSGVAPLSVQWSAFDSQHPLQQVDLYVDGKFFRTLTNAVPQAGNTLKTSLNGYPISYAVSSNDTPVSIAAGLSAAVNASLGTGSTKITATAFGDRIELHAATNSGYAFYYLDPFDPARPTRFYRTMSLAPPPAPQISNFGRRPSGAFSFHVEPPGPKQFSIEASTNLVDWSTLANNLSGSFDFTDSAASGLPSRFYRIAYGDQDVPPMQTAIGPVAGGFKLHIQNPQGACLVEASTNLVQWFPLLTNASDRAFDFVDSSASAYRMRFYRISSIFPPVLPPRPAVVAQTLEGDALMRMDSSSRPYVIQVSTDFIHWTSLFTNLTPSQLQLSGAGFMGGAAAATTFLSPGRPGFLNSPAQGVRNVYINGSINLGSTLTLTVAKTNHSIVSLSVTNQSTVATIVDLAQSFVGAINASPDLQGPDGVEAADVSEGWFGSATFNVRARSPGLEAAAIRCAVGVSFALVTMPGSDFALDQNLTDLQPRNHLYVSAGATNLPVAISLDTSQLSDGFHELTSVAFEGTSIRTQTRVSVPVVVSNSPLGADFILLDVPATNASAIGTYHIRVAANTTAISAIKLFSTGGLLAAVTNQSTATFAVDGTYLGPGLHPFYAIVETADGRSYRTRKELVRLRNP